MTSEEKSGAGVSSALGEIRALGALLQAQIPAKPISRGSSPRSDISIDMASPALVEVHNKQLNGEESEALKAFNQERPETKAGEVCVREHVVTPFGKPDIDHTGVAKQLK